MNAKRLERMTIHMRLSMFYTKDKDDQIVKMARRYLKTTASARIKKPLRSIINCPKPAKLVKEVYEDTFK